jgi:hypothetical protein
MLDLVVTTDISRTGPARAPVSIRDPKGVPIRVRGVLDHRQHVEIAGGNPPTQRRRTMHVHTSEIVTKLLHQHVNRHLRLRPPRLSPGHDFSGEHQPIVSVRTPLSNRPKSARLLQQL